MSRQGAVHVTVTTHVKLNIKYQVYYKICASKRLRIAGFQCDAIQNRPKEKSKPFNRLSPEAEKRKKVTIERLSPRFKSQQLSLCKICGERFSPNL